MVVLHEGTHDRRGVRTTDHVLAELGRDGLTAVTVSDLIVLSR